MQCPKDPHPCFHILFFILSCCSLFFVIIEGGSVRHAVLNRVTWPRGGSFECTLQRCDYIPRGQLAVCGSGCDWLTWLCDLSQHVNNGNTAFNSTGLLLNDLVGNFVSNHGVKNPYFLWTMHDLSSHGTSETLDCISSWLTRCLFPNVCKYSIITPLPGKDFLEKCLVGIWDFGRNCFFECCNSTSKVASFVGHSRTDKYQSYPVWV